MNVFLSYSLADANVARRLGDVLTAEGHTVWDAEKELEIGSNWYFEIGRVLEHSDAMVVLLSPSALKSRSVRFDIEHALTSIKFQNRLIPVLVKPTTNFPWILEQLHLIDATHDKEEGVRQVVAALRNSSTAIRHKRVAA